jgi:hypothetical protein
LFSKVQDSRLPNKPVQLEIANTLTIHNQESKLRNHFGRNLRIKPDLVNFGQVCNYELTYTAFETPHNPKTLTIIHR